MKKFISHSLLITLFSFSQFAQAFDLNGIQQKIKLTNIKKNNIDYVQINVCDSKNNNDCYSIGLKNRFYSVKELHEAIVKRAKSTLRLAYTIDAGVLIVTAVGYPMLVSASAAAQFLGALTMTAPVSLIVMAKDHYNNHVYPYKTIHVMDQNFLLNKTQVNEKDTELVENYIVELYAATQILDSRK